MNIALGTLRRVSVRRLRDGLGPWIRGVERGGEALIVTRRGRDVAAVVPLSTLALAALASRGIPDVAEAARGLREPAEIQAEAGAP